MPGKDLRQILRLRLADVTRVALARASFLWAAHADARLNERIRAANLL